MSPPDHHPLLNEIVVSIKKEKTDIRRGSRQAILVWTGGREGFGAMEQDLSVQTLQGGARHQGIRAGAPLSETQMHIVKEGIRNNC